MPEKEKILQKLNLEAEIDRLQKQIFVKDKQIRELQREVNDYAIREEQLVAEVTRLTAENAQHHTTTLLTGLQGSGTPAPTKEDFLNPKLGSGTGLNRAPKEGLEKEWSEMVLAYTDEIFVDELPKFILGESEQMLRAAFNDSDEPLDPISESNNAFIYLYDTLDAVYNDATSTYLDTHSPGEFDIATHIVNVEIRQAKQALVVAKMLVTKALTNDLMMK